MSEIKGKKILIAGFGREGKSVLRYIVKHYHQMDIAIADLNPEAVKDTTFEHYWGKDYLKDIAKFDTVIKTPGIPPSAEFKKAKHLTTLTNIFFEDHKGMIIGVTGTKGKSTTASLIAHILSQFKKDVRLVGNVGVPALDEIAYSTEETIFVLELSSYQLMNIHYSPDIAVLLPIYEEHLNYHRSIQNYVKAKAGITKFQTRDDYLYYYENNKYTKLIAQASKATKIAFRKFVGDTPLLGEANQINAGAALAVAAHFALPGKQILGAIASFTPLPNRLESVGIYKDIEFINDSLATIPEATIHALEAFGERAETLIAGGFDRGINYSHLGPAIVNSSVKTLILFPDTGKKIEKSLPKNNLKIFHTDSMKEAVKLAYKHTSKGNLVLLSPASTSFNMFKDYEERGNAFRQAVEELGK